MIGMASQDPEPNRSAVQHGRLRRWARAIIPKNMRSLYRLSHHASRVGWGRLLWLIHYVGEDLGHFRSCESNACVSGAGAPIPWYTYPAIDYLQSLDLQHALVFEYGAGNSSLFWAARTKRTWSVEDSPEWHAQVSARSVPSQSLLLKTTEQDYVSAIKVAGTPFDIIVIDGKYRMRCARAALEHLAPGGIIVLDNSDWHPETARLLREADLIQVDFTGAGPLNAYAWTTSLFLTRDFRPRPGSGALPGHHSGTLVQVAKSE